MLNPIIDSLEIKYYAVLSDLTFKEIETLEAVNTFRPQPFLLVRKQNIGKTESLYSSGFFAHSKYSFFDNDLNEFRFTSSGWALLAIEEPTDRSRGTYYKISDPNGEIRNIYSLSLDQNWTKYFQLDGICNIIHYIRGLSKYPAWTYHDLASENHTVKQENDKLKNRIKELEALVGTNPAEGSKA